MGRGTGEIVDETEDSVVKVESGTKFLFQKYQVTELQEMASQILKG
jgi:hypothetical protein